MLLTTMMQSYYAKPVILLIDEYDVPVAKANNNGYYDEMLDVMKGLMQALKDNQALRFAVVTGCLKIAKESIFTGTNNFVSDTITNSRLNEYFGFVQSEVDQLLKDADLKGQAENIKKWYDGYYLNRVGHVYSPNSVMEAINNEEFQNYWSQTETYESLKVYIEMDFDGLKQRIVEMLGGARIKIEVGSFQNDMTTFHCADDVLTLLIHLGYLAYDSKTEKAFIPNEEVRSAFVLAIRNRGWDEVYKAIENSEKLLKATLAMNETAVAKMLQDVHMQNSSSLVYNNEVSLASIIQLAYYTAAKEYTIIRELPAGEGFALSLIHI